ncbi:hypothetical protein B296_00018512, partial [Ensete ventricosum]
SVGVSYLLLVSDEAGCVGGGGGAPVIPPSAQPRCSPGQPKEPQRLGLEWELQ